MRVEVYHRGDPQAQAVIKDGRIYRLWHSTLFSNEMASGYVSGRRVVTRDHDELATVQGRKVWRGAELVAEVDLDGIVWERGQRIGSVSGADDDEAAAIGAAVLVCLDDLPLPLNDASNETRDTARKESPPRERSDASDDSATWASGGGSSASAPIDPLYYLYGVFILAVSLHDAVVQDRYTGDIAIMFVASAFALVLPTGIAIALLSGLVSLLVGLNHRSAWPDGMALERQKSSVQSAVCRAFLVIMTLGVIGVTYQDAAAARLQRPANAALVVPAPVSTPAPPPGSESARHHDRRRTHHRHAPR